MLFSPNFQIKGPTVLVMKLSLPHSSSAIWGKSTLLHTPYCQIMQCMKFIK